MIGLLYHETIMDIQLGKSGYAFRLNYRYYKKMQLYGSAPWRGKIVWIVKYIEKNHF